MHMMTVDSIVRRNALAYGERAAAIMDGRVLSFADLDRAAQPDGAHAAWPRHRPSGPGRRLVGQ